MSETTSAQQERAADATQPSPPMGTGRERLFGGFFFAAFAFLIYQLYLFLAPFAAPLVLAAILVLTFSPLTVRVLRSVGDRRTVTAIAMTLTVTAVVLVPAALLGGMLVRQASGSYTELHTLVETGQSVELLSSSSWLGETWQSLRERVPALGSLDLSQVTLEASKRASSFIATEAASVAKNVVATTINFFLMLVALFFLFRDGDRIAEFVTELIPMEPHAKHRVAQTLYDTVTAVVQSSLVIAVMQGVLGGIGYGWIGGLSVAVLLGFVTGVASFIPLGGSTLVWLPAAIYLFAAGEPARGLGLLLWGGLVIGSVDNFVRPLIIGGRVQMPTLLLLFALLGGLQVYGFLGIFVAPVAVAILLAFVEIYRREYGMESARPPAASADDAAG